MEWSTAQAPGLDRPGGDKTPRIGASGAEWSAAQAPGLDHPWRNPGPRTRTSEATERIRQKKAPDGSIWGRQEHGSNARTGSSGGAPGVAHWYIRGRNAPGLERPGTRRPGNGMSGATNKEKETAAERHGEENKNKSKERMGEVKKERRRKAGGEGEEGEAAKHMEPGWEQPGKQRNQSGSTGSGAAQEIVKQERPRLHEKGAAAAARTEKECMNRSQERWRERTRNTREGKGEEKGRQAHGTRTGTSGEAMRPDWNIRGAEALDTNSRGGNSPGLERPGPQKEEEMAAKRSDEEQVNSTDRHGPDGEGPDGREKGSGRRRSKRKSGQPRETRTRTTGGAAHPGRYIRGRGGHGKERPELQEDEEAAAARIDKG